MSEESERAYNPCGANIYENCLRQIVELKRKIEHFKGKLEALEEIKYDLENDWGFKEEDFD